MLVAMVAGSAKLSRMNIEISDCHFADIITQADGGVGGALGLAVHTEDFTDSKIVLRDNVFGNIQLVPVQHYCLGGEQAFALLGLCAIFVDSRDFRFKGGAVAVDLLARSENINVDMTVRKRR